MSAGEPAVRGVGGGSETLWVWDVQGFVFEWGLRCPERLRWVVARPRRPGALSAAPRWAPPLPSHDSTARRRSPPTRSPLRVRARSGVAAAGGGMRGPLPPGPPPREVPPGTRSTASRGTAATSALSPDPRPPVFSDSTPRTVPRLSLMLCRVVSSHSVVSSSRKNRTPAGGFSLCCNTAAPALPLS